MSSHYTKHIFLCTNQKPGGRACCAQTGGEVFFSYLKTRLQELELHGPGKIRVSKTGCLGRCDLGPCVVIYPEGTWYSYSSNADLDRIIEDHLMHDKQVTDLQL